MSAAPDSDVIADRTSGLVASLQRLVSNLLGMLQTRIDIVATEFEEERERIKQLVIFSVFALVFISLGSIALSIFAMLWLWDSLGVGALGVVGAVLLGAGIVIGAVAVTRERRRPRLFATTLSELAKDRRALRGEND